MSIYASRICLLQRAKLLLQVWIYGPNFLTNNSLKSKQKHQYLQVAKTTNWGAVQVFKPKKLQKKKNWAKVCPCAFRRKSGGAPIIIYSWSAALLLQQFSMSTNMSWFIPLTIVIMLLEVQRFKTIDLHTPHHMPWWFSAPLFAKTCSS